MENVEIAKVLGEVADLLEIQGANSFRIRAYRNAVRTVQGLARPLAQMVEEGEDLTKLPGVGSDISGYIRELVTTGKLAMLDDLAKEVPRSLEALLALEGVGPKKVKALYEQLGIESLADLEKALDSGAVEGLKGFGKKTVEHLRRSLADVRTEEHRFLLSEADQLVRPLVDYLNQAPGIFHVDVAGSYRRRRETVGDLDILAVCDEPKPVMDYFTAYDAVRRVVSAGDTRGTVVLRSGLQVDLRIVPRECYGAAMHYFTGSKAHNVAVRKRGVERGLRINEYGVFRVTKSGEQGKRLSGEKEGDVLAAVGLPWIPPELREDRGEIEAALRGALPTLIERRDVKGDLQIHSTWSDGKNTIEEMVRGCLDLGYDYVAVTDHSKQLAMTGGLTASRLEEQWAEIEEVRAAVPDILVLRGMEVDILQDGTLDLDDEHLSQLDIVLVAVHSHMDLSERVMTDRIIRALAHPAVDILAHPTGRILNRRGAYTVDVEAILQAAKEYDVAVELNANPERLDLQDVYLQRAKELGVPVTLGTDAHRVESLHNMAFGIDQARRGWLEKKDVVNAKSAGALTRWLGRKRGAKTGRRKEPAGRNA
jgi:DNA polymerase (family X)